MMPHMHLVQQLDGSILNYGDHPCSAFMRQKCSHIRRWTMILPNEKTKTRIDQLKNFGHVDETHVVAPGINGKMS